MPPAPSRFSSHLTLALCTLLHVFTHAYGSLLIPLYLMMTADLHLSGVNMATMIVTVYGGAYFLGSWYAGILADHSNRKTLLGIGLIGNALAIVGMALTHSYWVIMGMAVLAGLFGTLFHPAANALAPAHYPKSPGMAIGLLGIGSGLGFFLGPKYAGWRAATAHWHWGDISAWQRPCVEMGLIGVLCGVVFLLLAREAPRRMASEHGTRDLGRGLHRRVACIAFILSCRDFAGVATLTLSAIFLQKAHHLKVAETGTVVGATMLAAVVLNPVLTWLGPGRRRLPTLVAVLILAGAAVASVPAWSVWPAAAALLLFQTLQMGSYAVSDAALFERVDDIFRGRVAGLFLVIAGTIGATSPWIMGKWVDVLGPAAKSPSAYWPIFILLGALMCAATLSAPLIARLGAVHESIDPFTETAPATMARVG